MNSEKYLGIDGLPLLERRKKDVILVISGILCTT